MNRENILHEIAERTRVRVADEKKELPLSELRRAAERVKSEGFPFENALKNDGISFICEVKKASPSKGIIAEKFDYASIAQAYEKAGADAVSVLTEPFYFKGDGGHLREISQKISLPLLRKDFTVDEYMIYQAKVWGASAVLLICAITDSGRLREYIDTAHGLGLSALVETRDEYEIESALKSGARIIGVNNRDLKTFAVDTGHSAKLRRLVPNDIVFVSESGIKTHDDIKELAAIGADAVLVGETLMRSDNIGVKLKELRGGK